MFLNRHYGLTDTPPLATFDDDMDGMAYEYGGEMVNAVRVQVTPRSAGDANSILWQAVEPVRVEPHQPRTVLAPFRDGQGQPWGALHSIAGCAKAVDGAPSTSAHAPRERHAARRLRRAGGVRGSHDGSGHQCE